MRQYLNLATAVTAAAVAAALAADASFCCGCGCWLAAALVDRGGLQWSVAGCCCCYYIGYWCYCGCGCCGCCCVCGWCRWLVLLLLPLPGVLAAATTTASGDRLLRLVTGAGLLPLAAAAAGWCCGCFCLILWLLRLAHPAWVSFHFAVSESSVGVSESRQ